MYRMLFLPPHPLPHCHQNTVHSPNKDNIDKMISFRVSAIFLNDGIMEYAFAVYLKFN